MQGSLLHAVNMPSWLSWDSSFSAKTGVEEVKILGLILLSFVHHVQGRTDDGDSNTMIVPEWLHVVLDVCKQTMLRRQRIIK